MEREGGVVSLARTPGCDSPMGAAGGPWNLDPPGLTSLPRAHFYFFYLLFNKLVPYVRRAANNS